MQSTMLYQNGQVVLSQLSPFSGEYLVKLDRSAERPKEPCHNCVRELDVGGLERAWMASTVR
jgi:hypothetical protein